MRESSGYKSQQSFADAFGIAQSTVGNWEAGKREPNYDTTIRLADFFHVSIDYLLGRTNQKSMPEANMFSNSPAISSDTPLATDKLFLEITRMYGDKTASAFSMYLNLDSEDRGEVRGQMKQMLKANKYIGATSGSPFPTPSTESAV